jgi:hypothetical protein
MAKFDLTLKQAKIAQYTMIAMIVVFVIMLFTAIGLSANGDSKNAAIVGSSSIAPAVIAGVMMYIIWQGKIYNPYSTSTSQSQFATIGEIPGRTPQGNYGMNSTQGNYGMNSTQGNYGMNSTRQ